MATTAGSGAYESGATWIGGVVPSDVAIIATGHTVTFTTAVTLGTPGAGVAEGVIILTVQGTLQRQAGGSFRCVGDTRIENGFIDFETVPGGDWIFGDGGAGQRYRIRGSASSSQTASRIAFNGSLITKQNAAAGVGRILPDLATWFLGFSVTDCQLTDIGTSASSYGFCALDANLSGALQQFLIHDTDFLRCGAVRLLGCPANRHCDVQGMRFRQQLVAHGSALAIYINCTAPTTGTRVFDRVSAPDAWLGWAGSRAGFAGKVINVARTTDSSVTGALPTYYKDLLLTPRAVFTDSNFMLPGETVENIGILADTNAQGPIGIRGSGFILSGEMQTSNVLYQYTGANEENDWFSPPAPTGSVGPWVYKQDRWLTLPNGRGLPSGCVNSSHGTNLTSHKFMRSTGGTQESLSPTGNGFFAFNVGTSYAGHANMIQANEDNLIYGPPPPLNIYRWGFLHYSGSTAALAGASLSGTSNNSSTTTLLQCPGKAWPTSTRQAFADSGAKVVITANALGTGPPVGETRVIASNTATTITPTVAFSVAPNSGTGYKVYVLDVMPSSRKNAYYNCRAGVNYGPDGYSTTRSVMGVEGFVCTDLNALEVGSIDLGSGALAALFLDPTRGLINYANRYLGPAGHAATPPVWATGQTYVVGDRVRAATSTYFANEELWFECYLSKGSASAAADKPGDSANGRLYWRPSLAVDLGALIFAGTTITDADLGLTNVSPIVHCFAWVRRGWAPIDTRLINSNVAGNAAIGAVDYYSAAVTLASTQALVIGGSATMSPADPPPFSSTQAIVIGGASTLTIANATGHVSGVAKVRHAISGRARVPGRPGVSAVVSASAARELVSSVPLVIGGTATMTVAIKMASTQPLVIGGSADMSVAVRMDSTQALLIGGSATFTPASGTPADLTTLISDLGGGAYIAYDVRNGLTHAGGLVSAWDDAQGASGFGPQLAQATGSKQPAWDGTTVNFDGTDDVLYSAAVAALSLDTSRSMAFIGATGTGNSKYCLVIRNAGATRYLSIHTLSSGISARCSDSAGVVEQVTNVVPSTTIRCCATEQQSGTRAMRTTVFNGAIDTTPTPTGTIASENKLIALGAFNDAQTTFFSTAKVRAVIISPAGVYWTNTQWNLVRDWAVANHASVNA